MAKFIGRRGSVGLAKESSAGTIVTPTFWLPHTSLTFDDKIEGVTEESGLGRIEDSDAFHVVQKFGEGELEGDLYDYESGLILSSLLGASPSTAGGPTYTHTYSLANTNTHQSLSIAYEDPNHAKIFPYGVVDSLQITVEQNSPVTYTAGFKSRVARDWTASALTPDFTDIGNKFLHQHLIFKLASSTAGLSAASPISLKALELNIMANSEFDQVLGTVEPEAVLNHQFSIEGSVTLNFEDQTYRRYFLDNTYRAMGIYLQRSASSQINLEFPRVSFNEWEQDRSLNDIVGQTLQFKGHYDAANAVASISTATLVNTYAGTNY